MSEQTINLTEDQIKEALAEIQGAQDLDDSSALNSLNECEKNLHNIELEEQELAEGKAKSTVTPVFNVSSKPNEKIPQGSYIRQKKSDIRKALTLSNNTDLLITIIPKAKKKYVQDQMVQPYVDAMDKTLKAIHYRIERLLNALIPKRLRNLKALYGSKPFVHHPGFFWCCGEKAGFLKMWVTPDIIYYFDQHSEMSYLRKAYAPETLAKVDDLVTRYLEAASKLRSRRITLHAKLTRVDTYDDLINFNVDWAEELLNEILAEQNTSIQDILENTRAEDMKV